ncbi:Hypothetical protein ING2D1G_1395 [Peptoniphilus sp. ING2-D1G]|nr:Hypothetical protein ING2D1G_1395 [Peptoniphilus sp. ING2-D1G]
MIGGGTGISTIIKGIKKYNSNISAIVSMADDGGGSGILRDDLGMLPPGDVRNCLVALASTEGTMEKLLQYRFKNGTLKGQNFGNILIAALYEIYGGFDKALNELENVLSISGKVVPVTYENIHLVAEFENEDKCIGESIIPKMAYKLDTKIKRIGFFPATPLANRDALKAIEEADLIILGPGSLYTSVIPNLLVKGILESIVKSDAKKIYIQNIMTELGETLDFKVRDHIKALIAHSCDGIVDAVLINDEEVSENMKHKYIQTSKSTEIKIEDEDFDYLKENNIEVIRGNFLQEGISVRHDGEKIALVLKKFSLL